MYNNNDQFITAYNRLDSFLQSLVKTPNGKHVTMISYLERISPEKKRAELKTVRQHRNNVAHAVLPGMEKPIVPSKWIIFLLDELNWCKRNAAIIAPKLQKALNASSQASRRTLPEKSGGSAYGDYFQQMYGYKRHNPHAQAPRAHSNRTFAICMVSSRGTVAYFAGYKRDVIRTGFLNLKKESFEYIDTARTTGEAKTYPTRDAANFVAEALKRKRPRYHISVVPA